MYKFTIVTDEQSRKYLLRIAEEMVNFFGITEEEAIGRINRYWDNQEIMGDDLIYHELPSYWAKTIYSGNDLWWLKEKQGEPIKPIPYP